MNKHTTRSENDTINSKIKAFTESFNSHLFCYEIENNRIFIEPKINMEVLEKTTVYPIPNAPKWYAGITSLRGDMLMVMNMHFILGTNKQGTTKHLLKLEHPDFPPLAIAIDNLPYQRDIERLSTSSTDASNYPDWVKSVAESNNKIFLFVDHSTLFKAMQNNSIQQPDLATIKIAVED